MHIFHKWKAVAVDRFYICCKVLYKCEVCGKIKVKDFSGVWSLEDFNK